MLPFKFCLNQATKERWIETSIDGKALLNTPMLNKGTAFNYDERRTFGLLGKLPQRIETLDEQVERAYQQTKSYDYDKLQQNIYLNNLHDRNETVFYRLLVEHMTELLPVIYTPIVGTAVKEHGREFRQPRGIYISYPDKDHIEEILDNRSHPDIHLIVATDGEGVLGIGDQGVGAIDIPIAKLVVYTLCAGVNPAYTLPIMLDVGTNNQKLLDDPYYLGWRHPRISKEEYDEFIQAFIVAVNKKFPNVFLHWEDLGRANASRLLEQYRNHMCTFNDDIQGTGAVALAGVLSAIKVTKQPLSKQKFIIFGAGSAGMGMAEQILDAMLRSGMSEEEAVQQFWLVDRNGLIVEGMPDITESQKPFVRSKKETQNWKRNVRGEIDLLSVIEQVKPTVLIGSSTVFGAFNKNIVQTMARHCDRPIIFPMSNPTELSEADPRDLLEWTKGNALVASGSPFEQEHHADDKYPQIAQCNNALIFPALGLGILAAKANRLTDNMLWEASCALAAAAPIHKDPKGALLPLISQMRELRSVIAKAVMEQALTDGVAEADFSQGMDVLIDAVSWEPYYLPLKKWTK